MPKLLTATKIPPLDIFLSKSEELKSKGFEVIIPAFNNYDELFTVAAEVVEREDISVSVPVAVLSSAPGKGKAFREEIIYPIRSLGYRIILLPGDKAEDSTKELVRDAAGMGVFDFVFDPYKGEDILFRILNPATLADMGSLLEEHKRTEHEEDIKNIKKNKSHPAIAHCLRCLRKAIGWLLKQKESQMESQMSSGVCSSKKEEENGPLKHSEIDTLTGCYTRAYFENFRPPEKYSVVFIDLDQFKPVNDILGHEAGDKVLAAFGKTLAENLKGQDVAVRWGGDEFILILPDTAPEGAGSVVENLYVAWEKAAPDTGNLKVGFSYGIATGQGTDGLNEAIKAADKAMYVKKKSNKVSESPLAVVREAGQKEQVVYVQPACRETPWEIARQSATGIAVVLEVIVLLSAGIWLTNYTFQLLGKESPWLSKIAVWVVEFWKMVYAGVFG